MIHDPKILDYLGGITPIPFSGEVFRATRKSLDPLTFSTSGGRWSTKGGVAALYTSLDRDGAIAEISFHWNQLNPKPTKPALVHQLRVKAHQTLRILPADLNSLGVIVDRYAEINYIQTAQIGAAIAFLGYDGLLAPSARWPCENLILFNDSQHLSDELDVISTQEVDWISWERTAGRLADD